MPECFACTVPGVDRLDLAGIRFATLPNIAEVKAFGFARIAEVKGGSLTGVLGGLLCGPRSTRHRPVSQQFEATGQSEGLPFSGPFLVGVVFLALFARGLGRNLGRLAAVHINQRLAFVAGHGASLHRRQAVRPKRRIVLPNNVNLVPLE